MHHRHGPPITKYMGIRNVLLKQKLDKALRYLKKGKAADNWLGFKKGILAESEIAERVLRKRFFSYVEYNFAQIGKNEMSENEKDTLRALCLIETTKEDNSMPRT